MDPLKAIYALIHDLVFQHIEPTDLFENLMLVSPSWNESVSNSKFFKENYKLVLDIHGKTSKDLITTVTRNYHHVEVQMCNDSKCHHRGAEKIKITKKEKSNWSEHVATILISLQNSMKTLMLGELEHESHDCHRIELPELESFKAQSVATTILNTIFRSARKLKELDVREGDYKDCDPDMEIEMLDNLAQCLRANKRLNHLCLDGPRFFHIFEEYFNMKFKLETLRFIYEGENHNCSYAAIYFKNFLLSQGDSLKALTIYFPGYDIEKFVIESLTTLKTFSVNDVYFPEPVKKNHSIKYLTILPLKKPVHYDYLPNIDMYSEFPRTEIFKALPCLKKVNIDQIDEGIIRTLAYNCPFIRDAKVENVNLDKILREYTILKIVNPSINQLIRINGKNYFDLFSLLTNQPVGPYTIFGYKVPIINSIREYLFSQGAGYSTYH